MVMCKRNHEVAPVSEVKLGSSRQVVIPKKIHDELGLKPGDYLEVEVLGGRLVLTPKVLIEKRLEEAMEDVRRGRVHGPFPSVDAMLGSLHSAAESVPSRRDC